MNKDLTAQQHDYSVFLPAVSCFYSTFVGKQRSSNYVDPARIPSNFANGVESLNFLNPEQGAFYYKWCLYSAGHANLDFSKPDPGEDMFWKRDRKTSIAFGDSGGYQIGKGRWQGDWKNPNCPAASKKRRQVLAWMDEFMDYGMGLDIPAWLTRSPEGQLATGITTYQDAVNGTFINNEYFIKNRNGNCKFLNVLQGETHAEADDWYNRMKKYCDPKQYPDAHFNGWGMGGQNMCYFHLTLKRVVALRFDGLLETGVHDKMHFLGTSKLEWAVLLTDLQRAVRKYHNPNFTVTFDCASPFLSTANGQIYTSNETPDRGKWTYRMVPSVDDKKYATDSRGFRDVVLNDGHFKAFEDSPISDGLKISDICVYAPGDLNKIGKEGKTSWDSFSYAIQMGHNVWSHINAVQEANRQYDAGLYPRVMIQENHDRLIVRDLIDAIFATDDRDKANQLIEDHSRVWMSIPGTRGAVGQKTLNSKTKYYEFFIEEDTPEIREHSDEFTDEEIETLETLETINDKDNK